MPIISQASIDSLKQQANIIEIIGSVIELKKSGINFSACCPFHSEKTPSFFVNPNGFYHCYGCGVGGDVFRFFMEYEKLSFTESVEKVAAMSGFTLSYEQGSDYKKVDSKLLESMARFYVKNLSKHKQSRDYLSSRSISNASIEKFGIGYCGSNFETMSYINSNGFDKQEALNLGILGRDNERFYARFTDRIMFPISDINGKIVGFGGRTMSDSKAKYINSPQTKLFNKSKLLYGYHLAKHGIFKLKKIIVCEGYIDVIALHQAGFENAVATLGTALTKEHLPLLKKGGPQVILSYDGDSAGVNAALKASKMLSQASIDGGVVIFANGADPADMVANKQIEDLSKLFSNPMPFAEFVFRQIALSFNLANPLQKEKAMIESKQFLHTLSPILQDFYKSFIANLLALPQNLIATKKPSQQTYNLPNNADSMAEAILVKTLCEKKDYISICLEYIDSTMFRFHKEAFNAILKSDFENPKIIGILINEHIKILESKNALYTHLRLMIQVAYKLDLAQIPRIATLDIRQKQTIIANIKNKILLLKKGELLAYESISTF